MILTHTETTSVETEVTHTPIPKEIVNTNRGRDHHLMIREKVIAYGTEVIGQERVHGQVCQQRAESSVPYHSWR